jgi:uncharacterized membrane protein YfcA
MSELHEIAIVALAGLAAGFVNALAGGGNLIAFPALMAIGIPPILANVTSTVSVTPAYVTGTFAQKEGLDGQRGRVRLLLPISIGGAVLGAVLLLVTDRARLNRLYGPMTLDEEIEVEAGAVLARTEGKL